MLDIIIDIIALIFRLIFVVLLLMVVWKSKKIFSKPFILQINNDGKELEIGIFWVALITLLV